MLHPLTAHDYLNDIAEVWQSSLQCALWSLQRCLVCSVKASACLISLSAQTGICAIFRHLDCNVPSFEGHCHSLRYWHRLLADPRLFAVYGQVCATARLYSRLLMSERRGAPSESTVHAILLRHGVQSGLTTASARKANLTGRACQP